MDSIRHLEELVARVDFKSDSKQDHGAIYSYIEQLVLSPTSPIVKHVPTLPVIIYSIKNILYPTLATRRIPELLDLLATAEFYRGRTLDQARAALTWNDYYSANPPTVLLTNEEMEFIHRLESQMADLRPIYIMILTKCCHLDMYNLWTTHPPSMTNFLIRFNEYFPFLNQSYDNHSPRLFHYNLTNNELAHLADTGLKCCDFAKETAKRAKCQAHDHPTHSKNFVERPCKPSDLVDLIVYFVDRTRDAARDVQDMFSEKNPRG